MVEGGRFIISKNSGRGGGQVVKLLAHDREVSSSNTAADLKNHITKLFFQKWLLAI